MTTMVISPFGQLGLWATKGGGWGGFCGVTWCAPPPQPPIMMGGRPLYNATDFPSLDNALPSLAVRRSHES
jgi:hypothetical protein